MFDQPPQKIGFHPDQELTAITTLPAAVWQDALRLIQDWPWRVANPIISQWMPQLRHQEAPPEPAPEPEPVAVVEGETDPA